MPAKNSERVKATIYWPSKSQQEKRHCGPYAEYVLNGVTWRAHFTVHRGYYKDRPSELWVMVSNHDHYLYDQQRGGVNFNVKTKAVVSSRSHTH